MYVDGREKRFRNGVPSCVLLRKLPEWRSVTKIPLLLHQKYLTKTPMPKKTRKESI
jgi:hypothetical protein